MSNSRADSFKPRSKEEYESIGQDLGLSADTMAELDNIFFGDPFKNVPFIPQHMIDQHLFSREVASKLWPVIKSRKPGLPEAKTHCPSCGQMLPKYSVSVVLTCTEFTICKSELQTPGPSSVDAMWHRLVGAVLL